MKNRIAVAVGVIVALALHVMLGWMWSVAGSLVAGFMVSKRSAWSGALTLIVSWALLIGWNMAVAPAENLNMMETMAELLGGMPGFVIPFATLLIAAVLGLAAGALGGALKPKRSA